MMRVADYIAEYVFRLGVHDVFMVTGGGMMFLSDAVAQHPHLKAICSHHEQASAMGAVSYARYTGNMGAVFVTTGCGGTNTITGLLDAWQESVPCLFVSGQSKRKETIGNSGLRLRQFGVQEADLVSIVASITKHAVMVNEPSRIAYHLDKAVHLARSGRPGPVWLDIPLDVQGASVDEAELSRFTPSPEGREYKEDPTGAELDGVRAALAAARRPVLIAGHGIRTAGAIPQLQDFLAGFPMPVVATKLGIDLLPSDHPLFIGRIGTKGDRAGNFTVQNSDLVLSVGSRLSIGSTGYEYKTFARGARIIVVDIDPEEHKKNTVRIDTFINADAKCFLNRINVGPTRPHKKTWVAWANRCRDWRARYPVCLPEYAKETKGINVYYFVDQLSRRLRDDAVVVCDAGSASYVVPQGIRLKKGQRLITSGSQGEMGYTIPATVGISIARRKSEVIGVTGDGSFQMNIQELQTIVHHDLPVKIFVWNNDGYLSIRATQRKFFDGRYIGTEPSTGVSFPSIRKIANAYGIKYFRAADTASLGKVLEEVLAYPKAVLCEVICLRDQEIVPTVASYRKEDGSMVSRPLEDMYPFLDREEFRREMIVKPLSE